MRCISTPLAPLKPLLPPPAYLPPRWDVFEGRLAPQALPRRQMSTGLDGIPASAFELLPAPGEEQPAAAAAASLSRAHTPLPLQLSRAPTPVGPIERASSLTAALPQQSTA